MKTNLSKRKKSQLSLPSTRITRIHKSQIGGSQVKSPFGKIQFNNTRLESEGDLEGGQLNIIVASKVANFCFNHGKSYPQRIWHTPKKNKPDTGGYRYPAINS